VLASPDQSLSDEAIRVVSKSPKWKPGIKDGKRVRTYFIMSVLFGPQGDSPSTEVIAQESLQQEITDMPVADTTSSNEQINGSVIYWLKYEDRELSLADLNALNPDNIESSNIVIAPGEIKMYTSRVKRDSADAVIEIKTKKYAPEYDILYWFLDENREITPDELKTYDANSLKTFKVIDDDDDDDDYSERLRQIIGDRKFAGVSIIGSNDLKNSEDALEELGYRMPKFMGGDLEKFRNRLMDKIVYPRLALERNIQGKVVIKFVVEKDGSIGDIKELSSPDPLLTEKTVRVLKSSPKWSPGTIDDKPVRVAYVLPIIFRL
jgi:TonB family protein